VRPVDDGVSERELSAWTAILLVGAAAAFVVAALLAAGALPGGWTVTAAVVVVALFALLGARRFARIRSQLRTAPDADDHASADAGELTPLVEYVPPVVMVGALGGGFGYLLGGADVAILLGGGAALLVFMGLLAPPLAPIAESPLRRGLRRLAGRRPRGW
jgi:hypothetical protein